MQKVIRSYIGFQFFFNLLLWVPIFYTFQKRLGLSDPEIFGIQSIYYIAFCLLEVPTGLIADRWGCRFSMVLGAGVLAVANVLPMVDGHYAGMLAHFLAVALARSLISGASSAYLYEYLKGQGAAERYKKVEADARFYSLLGRIAAWAAVGWLMAWQLTSPYWLSALNAAVALAIGLSMPPVGGRAATAKNTLQVLRSSMTLRLGLLMLQGVGIFVMVRILQVNLYQPVLTSRAFDVTVFGWSMSLMTAFEAFGSKAAPLLRKRVDDLSVVTGSTLALCASLCIVALTGQLGTLAGFCLFSFAAGLAFPVQKQLLNDAISDSRQRATLLSLESIVDRACCAVAVLPLGGLVAAGYLNGALMTVGLVIAGAALVIQWAVRTYRYPLPSSLSDS